MKESWKQDLWVEVRVDRDGRWHASVPDDRALTCSAGTMDSAVAGLYAACRSRRSGRQKRRRGPDPSSTS